MRSILRKFERPKFSWTWKMKIIAKSILKWMYFMNVPTEKNMICYLEKPGLPAKIRITIINMLFSSVFLLKTRTILRSFWRTSFNNRGDYKSEFMFSTKVIVPWGMSQTWTIVLFTNHSDNWTPENKPTMSEKM